MPVEREASIAAGAAAEACARKPAARRRRVHNEAVNRSPRVRSRAILVRAHVSAPRPTHARPTGLVSLRKVRLRAAIITPLDRPRNSALRRRRRRAVVETKLRNSKEPCSGGPVCLFTAAAHRAPTVLRGGLRRNRGVLGAARRREHAGARTD